MVSHDGRPYLRLHQGSRTWYIHWRHLGRIHRRSTRETKKAAAELALRVFTQRYEALTVDAHLLTFHAALQEWYDEKALPRYGLGHSTLRSYRIFVQQVKALVPATVKLIDVGTREISHLLGLLEQRHRLSPATMKAKIVIMSGIFRWHQRRRSIDRNPVDGIERPRVRHVPTPEITRAQYEDLLARTAEMRDSAISVHDRGHAEVLHDFLQVLWLSGHRRIELCRLAWKDVDLRAGTWWIRSPEKKGGERIEPIHLKLIPILQGRRKDARAGPFNLNVVEKAWKKLKARHPDLPIRTLHSFRSAFATRMALQSGETAAQYLLGHKSPTMTRRYVRATGLNFREQLEALE